MTKSGICNHSSGTAFESYAIFSTVAHKQDALRKYLLKTDDPCGMGSRELVGMYKGDIEPAWIVNERRLPDLHAEGFLIEQESILMLGKNPRGARNALLVFIGKSDPVDLGHFVNVPETQALRADNWTFCPADKSYWICTKGD